MHKVGGRVCGEYFNKTTDTVILEDLSGFDPSFLGVE